MYLKAKKKKKGEFFHGVVGVSASSELGGLVVLADLINPMVLHDLIQTPGR